MAFKKIKQAESASESSTVSLGIKCQPSGSHFLFLLRVLVFFYLNILNLKIHQTKHADELGNVVCLVWVMIVL